jgi:hypothetical protein
MLIVTVIVPTFSLFLFQDIPNTDEETHTILLYNAPTPNKMPNVSQVSGIYLYNEKTKLSANSVPDCLHFHSAVNGDFLIYPNVPM